MNKIKWFSIHNLTQWDPPTLDKVNGEQVDIVFQPFKEELELQIPEKEECRSVWL